MGEKYLEDTVRYLFEKAALFIRLNLVDIGNYLDHFHINETDESGAFNFNFGKYAIFGFFFCIVALFYFSQIDTIFAPSHISFSFLVIFLSGVFLYFNKA